MPNSIIRQTVSNDIPDQFPALYRESGEMLVDFVQEYYKFVEENITNTREAFIVRDIDSTYDRFLNYFKNKYLSNLPTSGNTDPRFIIKHIQDLYSRKGSKESVLLYFRLFFSEDAEVFLPAGNILKPSDSIYGSNSYFEMEPVSSVGSYVIKRGDKVTGATTKSQAYVDNVIFKVFQGTIVPIVLLSNIVGTFSVDDDLEITNRTIPREVVIPRIRGSVTSADVNRYKRREANNKVGEEVLLISKNKGTGAKGIITGVTLSPSGSIEVNVEEPGWGYTKPVEMTVGSVIDDTPVASTTVVVYSSIKLDHKRTLKFAGDKTFYHIVSAVENIPANPNEYTVTLARGLNKAITTAQSVGIYRANSVNEFEMTNQVVIVHPDYDVQTTISAGDEIIFDFNYLWAAQQPDNTGPFYVQATNTLSSEFGYVYPLYTDQVLAAQKDVAGETATYTFSEYPGVNFYMPLYLQTAYDLNVLPQKYNWTGKIYESPLPFIYFNIDRFAAIDSMDITNQIDTPKYVFVNDEMIQLRTIVEFNDSADIAIGDFYEPETVYLVPDIIGDFFNTQINASDYDMSGPGQENLQTQFKDAFERQEFIIGGINNIEIIDSGYDYRNGIYVTAFQPTISKFLYADYGIEFANLTSVIVKGDKLSQEITLYTGEAYTVKAECIGRSGNVYFFRPLSFYRLDPDLPVVVRGNTLTMSSVENRSEGPFIGANAIIDSTTNDSVGQVQSIKIIDSGYLYNTDELVELRKVVSTTVTAGEIVAGLRYRVVNPGTTDLTLVGAPFNLERVEFVATADGSTLPEFDTSTTLTQLEYNYVAQANVNLLGSGYTEGFWRTTTSFLNNRDRVIRDNYYYQEYSFEISSSISPERYEESIKDNIVPVGTKLFSAPLINTINNLSADVDLEISSYNITSEDMATEEGVILSSIRYFLLAGAVGLTGTDPSTGANWSNMHNLLATDDGTGRILGQITGTIDAGDVSNSASALAIFKYTELGTTGDATQDANCQTLIDAINNDVSIRNDSIDNNGVTYYIWQHFEIIVSEAGEELLATNDSLIQNII